MVSPWPPASTRTRSIGAMVALTPNTAAPPVLSLLFFSEPVLANRAADVGSSLMPVGGVRALACPYSRLLLALNGMAAAR